MGKKKNKGFTLKEYKVPSHTKYIVVMNPWGIQGQHTSAGQFSQPDINRICAWIELMVKEEHPNASVSAIYYQKQKSNFVIVELPGDVDVERYLGRHEYRKFLTSPAPDEMDRKADIYMYKYHRHGPPENNNFVVSYSNYVQIPQSIPIKREDYPRSEPGSPVPDVMYASPLPEAVTQRLMMRVLDGWRPGDPPPFDGQAQQVQQVQEAEVQALEHPLPARPSNSAPAPEKTFDPGSSFSNAEAGPSNWDRREDAARGMPPPASRSPTRYESERAPTTDPRKRLPSVKVEKTEAKVEVLPDIPKGSPAPVEPETSFTPYVRPSNLPHIESRQTTEDTIATLASDRFSGKKLDLDPYDEEEAAQSLLRSNSPLSIKKDEETDEDSKWNGKQEVVDNMDYRTSVTLEAELQSLPPELAGELSTPAPEEPPERSIGLAQSTVKAEPLDAEMHQPEENYANSDESSYQLSAKLEAELQSLPPELLSGMVRPTPPESSIEPVVKAEPQDTEMLQPEQSYTLSDALRADLAALPSYLLQGKVKPEGGEGVRIKQEQLASQGLSSGNKRPSEGAQSIGFKRIKTES